MKALVITEPGKLQMQDVPEPKLTDPYRCLCRMLFSASCSGTDHKLIHNTTPWDNQYPAILGHEGVGEVIEVGDKVRNFEKGDIVLRPSCVFPTEFHEGYYSAWGGMAEMGLIADWHAQQEDGVDNANMIGKYQMKIPRHWKDDPSSPMLITLKETFSWLNHLRPLYGKDVAVIGTGTVGLFFVRLARIMCAGSVTAFGRRAATLELADELGADTVVDIRKTGDLLQFGQYDLLIDAAGVLSKIQDYIPLVRRGGMIAVYATAETDEARFISFGSGLNFSFHDTMEGDEMVHKTCIGLVEHGVVDPARFHSSVVPFEQAVEAYERLEQKKEFKIVCTF